MKLKKWILKNKSELIDDIYDNKCFIIIDKFDVMKELLNKRTIENFGEIEYHTGYEREIKWWSLTEIKTLQESNHLHFRLRDPRINQSILKSLPSKTPSKIPKETPKNL